MLEHFITSRAKRNVLKLLLTNPNKPFYIHELSRLTGEPVNAVSRETRNLEKAGLLKSKKQGNLKYYEVQKEFPLYHEFKKIIYSTVGLREYLEQYVRHWDDVEIAFIYGSVANDEETSASDIDLFIVGPLEENVLHQAISRIEKETGRTINYILMSTEEFHRRIRNGEPFLKRVMDSPKIVIKGTNE